MILWEDSYGQTLPQPFRSEAHTVARDRYNKVTFKPVTTSGLRLEIVIH